MNTVAAAFHGAKKQLQACECWRRVVTRFPAMPAGGCPADGDPRVVASEVGEFAGVVGAGDDMADLAAREAIDEIVAVQ